MTNKRKETPPPKINTPQQENVEKSMAASVGDDSEIYVNQEGNAIADGEGKGTIDTGDEMQD